VRWRHQRINPSVDAASALSSTTHIDERLLLIGRALEMCPAQ